MPASSKLIQLLRDKIGPLGGTELFALGNIAFLAIDIFMAHSSNGFANKAEWIPVVFSVGSSLLLFITLLMTGVHPPLPEGTTGPGPQPSANRIKLQFARQLGLLIGWGSVLVGVVGMLLHLNDTFFREQTLHNLVYTAPFIAPLSYAGLGLLLILNRTIAAASSEWARWVVCLALGGMFGNFGLSLADHAQNGFFDAREWIGVYAGAIGVGVLLGVLVAARNRVWLRFALGVMLMECFVGAIGAWFHIQADLQGEMGSLWESLLYGAPVFAPMLFPNLALLAMLGLWDLLQQLPSPPQAR